MNAFPWMCRGCGATAPAGANACPKCGRHDAASSGSTRTMPAAGAVPATGAAPVCPKCAGAMCLRTELRGSAGGLSAVFELSNARFHCVSCERCGFTEC